MRTNDATRLVTLQRFYVTLALLCALTSSVTGQSDDVLESSVGRGALLVLASSGQSSWPEFVPPREFIVCPTSGGALIALRGSIGATPIGRRLTTVNETHLFYSDDRPVGLERRCFILDFGFAGRTLLAFPQLDSIYSLSDPARAMAAALVHEEFHRHQMQLFRPTNGPEGFHQLEAAPRLPFALITSPRFQRSAREERRLLAAALISPSAGSKRTLLSRYVRLRERRREMVPQSLRAGEAHEERKEGSAHLASYEFLASAAGEDRLYIIDLVRRDLLNTPPFDANREQSSFRHWHIYATGAAIGLILDQLGVDWRRALVEGATFLDLARVAAEHAEPGA